MLNRKTQNYMLKLKSKSASWRTESCVKCLKCVRRLKRKNIKRFKPQAFQASSFKADSDFRQNDSYKKSSFLN